MRKVPPILKPIALMTISILVATATGVANGKSYRHPNPDRSGSSTTEPAVSENSTTGSTSSDSRLIPESSSSNTAPQTNVPSSTESNNQKSIPDSSLPADSSGNQTVPSSSETVETKPSSQDQNAPVQQKQPASTSETREAP